MSMQYVVGKEDHIPGSTSPVRHEYSGLHYYLQLKGISEIYFNSLAGTVTGLYAEIYLSNKNFFNNYTATILSAQKFQPIPESSTLFLPNYRANNYLALGVKEIFPINKSIDLRTEFYLFQPFKNIINDPASSLAYYGKEFDTRSFIGSMAFVYETPVGPISLSLNYYDKGKNSFSVIFNIGYIIFNKFALE